MPKYITHPLTGETLSQTDWEKKLGLKHGIISARLKYMPLEKALTGDRLNSSKYLTHPVTGEIYNQKEWAARLKISNATLHGRLKRLPLDKALSSKRFFKERVVTHPLSGETLTVREWGEKLHISKSQLFKRLKKFPLVEALTPQGLVKITHPLTGETLTQRQWAQKLGISKSTLQYRLKFFPYEEVLSENFRNRAWTPEEDEYLLIVWAMPALHKHWDWYAKKMNWFPRSRESLRIRIRFLSKMGDVSTRRNCDEESGWLAASQLSRKLGVSETVVQRWIRDFNLKGYAGDGKIKIHLSHFALWVTSPNGQGEISKTLNSNPLAISWVLHQIGNWIKEVPPLGALKPIVKSRQTQTVVLR